MLKIQRIAGAALVVLLAAPAAAQETYVAVIVGLGGEPEHAETFRRWAGSLVDQRIRSRMKSAPPAGRRRMRS
jgi:hypothetical protein